MDTTCALDGNAVVCWGLLPQVPNRQFATPPSHLTVGLQHACVIVNNEVECWGKNDFSQTIVPRDIILN
jgi:hypothetical protein